MRNNATAVTLVMRADSGLGSNAGKRPPENLLLQITTSSLNPPRRSARACELEMLSTTLNEAERRERSECEEIIRQGWDTFLEVGCALTTIRQKHLYRDRYRTFEEYCRQKWGFSKTHANRLIEAAAVAAVLTPIGVKLNSESQVRPLVGLAPQKIPAAWKKAQEFAEGGEITAKVVRRAAEEFKTDSPHCAKTAQRKKAGSIPTGLKLALNLIDKAEEATKKKDIQAVLNALGELRKCLLHC
jgi:hypothetical protein